MFNPKSVMSIFTWFKHNSGEWVAGGTSQATGTLNSWQLELLSQKCQQPVEQGAYSADYRAESKEKEVYRWKKPALWQAVASHGEANRKCLQTQRRIRREQGASAARVISTAERGRSLTWLVLPVSLAPSRFQAALLSWTPLCFSFFFFFLIFIYLAALSLSCGM